MLSDKKLQKIEKAVGPETMSELEALTVEGLKDRIAASEASINNAIRELEANPKFQELKESLKAISEGLREVKKRQRGVIDYSVSLIEDKGAQ
jgi:hypothetical protein